MSGKSNDGGDQSGRLSEASAPGYRVELAASAQRSLDAIAPRYIAAIVEFMFGPLADNPQRVGKPLRHDLAGLQSARRGDYRVIYEIDPPGHAGVVLVHRIHHRAHVYRRS